MTTFFYKSGGRISRYLIDYGTYPIAQLGIDTLDDFWEEQYQTRRIEEITYGTVGDAGPYGIGSKIKSLRSASYTGDDDQWSNGGYFIVGESGTSIGRFTNAWESRSYNYYPGIVDYYTELDYGLISNTPTTINDCGSITVGVVNESVDHGHIWIETTQWAFLPDIKVISAVSWKATEAFVGDGRLWSWGEQSSPAVYGSITDGKVRISGTADVDFSPAIDGRGVAPLQGTSGIVFSPSIVGVGTLSKFTGTAYSLTVNPYEKQILFSFTGVLGEVRAANYYGSGYLKNFSNTDGDKSFAYVGSGSIRLFARKLYSPSDEKHTESYNPSSIVVWNSVDWGTIGGCNNIETISTSSDVTGVSTGCIVKIDQGVTARVDTSYQIAANNNAASNFIDYGEVAHSHTTFENRGNILVTSNLMPLGDIKIDPTKGAGTIFKPNWVGRGTIKITGDAKLPLFASVLADGLFKVGGAAITNFALGTPGTGLFRISSLTNTPRSRIHIGSGNLRKLGGSAESITINPTEKQLLFSFVGEHQVKFGYGTWQGSGNIKNLAGGIETGTFDYVGSGSIITWNKLEEAVTSAYNCSSVVPWVDLNYGLILDRNNTTCVTDSGDKTSDVTAVSGCIKVAPGTTLSIADPNTYTIPSQQTVPSITEDYGSVAKSTPITREYGWILGTVAHGMPSCVYGELDVSGSAAIKFIPNWVGSGILKLSGDAKLPLFASHTTEGPFGPLTGAAITNFSLGTPGDGLFDIVGDTLTSVSKNEIIDGLFSTFSGAAESVIWNPEETQMLFSFTGGYSSLEFSYGSFIGDGVLFTFSGGEERGTYSYTGSGSIITWNKLEEAITYFYNCSSIVEFGVYDYGQLVDLSNVACVLDSGDKTSDVTAVSGCIKVAPGTTLSIAPNNTYTIPSQTTIPSTYLDYGSVTKLAAPTDDYGWILGTVTHGMPSCIYGTIDVVGTASTQHVQGYVGGVDFVGTGLGYIYLSGEARLPLFASHTTEGPFGPLTGAAFTSLSTKSAGDGLYHIGGISSTNIGRKEIGEGIFSTFSGSAESVTWNPEETQMLFSFTGGYTDLKFAYGAFEGDGILWNFAGGDERGTFSYTGSGSIATWNKLEEAITYWYNCSSVVPWTDLDYGLLVSAAQATCVTDSGLKTGDITAVSGCIKVAPGTTLTIDSGSTYTIPSHRTVPTSFEDYGSVTRLAAPTKDYGWILGTVDDGMPSCIYGTIQISGTVDAKFQPSWTSRGGLRLDNDAKTNFSLLHNGFGTLFEFSGASEVLSAAIEGRGLFRISSLTETPRARAYEGYGTLRKISGTAVSLTVNPEETQMLFSFTGGVSSEKHTEAYSGSGFLRNFASVETRTAFDYASSGVIKLRSRTEESETHVYDLNLCYSPPHYDYGLLVSTSQATCVVDSGIKTTDVTAVSGCIKVEPGTTLAIASSNIYTIPSHLTVPTSTEDYHNIIDLHRGTRDYGHILGSLSRTCPFGSIEFWNEATCAEVQVYTFVGTGESSHWSTQGIRIDNEAIVTVPPQWNGYGVLDISKFSVGSITGFSLLHIGDGNLFSMGGAAESVRYSPDEEQLLFKVVPGPFGRWTSYDWQPSWVSKGYIKGAIGEAKTHYVPDVVTSGNIKSLSGGAEAIAYSPDLGEDNFYVCVDKEGVITTTTVATSGCIKVAPGTILEITPGVYYQVPPTYQGSIAGTDDRSIGKIVGEATESFTSVETGSGLVSFNNLGIASAVFFIPNYPGYGVIPVTGDARIYYTPHVIGEGIIWNYSGTAESITVNPDEKQMLFSFIGTRESEVISVTETGFGTAIFGGEVYTTASISEDGFGTVSVLGAGDTTRSRIKVGSGTLRKFAGAAESITVNPEEKQMLFSFIGEGADSRSVVTTGDGRLFAFTGAAETTLVAWEGSGLYRISGDAYVIGSLSHIGSGTLRKFSGAAESLTVNPDERQLLFSFTGESRERHTESYDGFGSLNVYGELTHPDIDYTPHITGSGTFNVLGDAGIRWVPNNVGEGTIFTIAGGAESITINPDEKQMLFSFTGEHQVSFTANPPEEGTEILISGTSGDPLLTFAEQPFVQTKISGEVRFTVHRSIFGTGSLYTISGAAESITVNPEEEQILFSVAGDSTIRTTSSYVGTGSLRKLSGSAESISFNPDEKQLLFSFTGAGTQSTTTREIGTGTLSTTGKAGVLVRFAHTGEGTISLSGDAYTTRTRDYVGFGTFRKLSGAAESITFNPTERDMLFSFHGTRIAEITTVSELSKGGTLVVGSTSGDPNLTFAEQPYVNIDVTGDSYDIRTRAYQGSGTLSNLHSADESLALAPYIGSGTTRITGIAIVQVQLFQPAHVQVWII